MPGVLSLSVTLSSPVLCSENSSLLTLPVSSAPSPQLREFVTLCLVAPLPGPWPGSSLKVVSWGDHRAQLINSPYLRDYYTSLPDVKCLEKCRIF